MTNTTIAKIVLTAAIALGVVGFFWHSSSSHTGAYKMVDEAVAVAPEWQGKEIKVHGWVQAGTIDEQIVGQEMHRTFVLEHKGATILVKNTGPKPDTFRDKAEVVADGKLVDAEALHAMWDAQLMLKAQSVPPLRLGSGNRLGYTSWLGRRCSEAPAADLILDVNRALERHAASHAQPSETTR